MDSISKYNVSIVHNFSSIKFIEDAANIMDYDLLSYTINKLIKE
jgi:hypothetical protein